MSDHEAAERDYMGGMKYKDIATKYGVSLSTVKSWKTRYKWNKKGMHTKAEKVRIQKKVCEEVKLVCENPNLSDKQRAFCLQYVRRFNATKAYQAAYGSSYEVANAEGYKLLVNPRVKAEIERLKQERLNREFLTESDIFQKYMDIAFADITDFVEFGRETVPVMAAMGPVETTDPETGEKYQLTKEVNTVRFKESNMVDGSLISEIKQGRDGASIKLPDRIKALEWLTDHMGMATEEQRARIDKLRAEASRVNTVDGESDDFGVAMLPEVIQDA